MTNNDFWHGKRVFVTGHTGFKGSWLSLWLQHLGADVTGFSLSPPTEPGLFDLANVGRDMRSVIGDVRDVAAVTKAMSETKPDIVVHMAAQSLVRYSYHNPAETYAVNVMGSVHVFEAARQTDSVQSIVNVTSDKCYRNNEWVWGYRESDRLGGYDPYSSSKACSEIITDAYRNSFFNSTNFSEHGVSIASVRAGNVIGGGDWATDRLVPDMMRAIYNGLPIKIRNPHSIRPWQHVLEPLSGYLLLAERLFADKGNIENSWNFGANDEDAKPVSWIVDYLTSKWGDNASYKIDGDPQPHEAKYLKLDCSKAKTELGWNPHWSLEVCLNNIISWHKSHLAGDDMRDVTLQQIGLFSK